MAVREVGQKEVGVREVEGGGGRWSEVEECKTGSAVRWRGAPVLLSFSTLSPLHGAATACA